MAVNQESLNKKLYDLLKTKGYSPIPKNTKNQRTENPQEADVFNFTYRKQGEDVGDAWVSIDDAQDVILYYESDLFDKGGRTRDNEFDDSWTGFVQQLKRWAMTKQLGFELRAKNKLGDDMAQREFTMKKETISEGYYPMTKQSSYSDNVPTVKIVLQHTRQIQEGEQRYRNIARIFLENQQGERILAPTIRPGIAQVYARHLAEGGLPNDDRWNHIKGLCEEYNKMAGFVRATRNGQFNESAMALVTEGANHYQNLRETLSKMRGSRGYHKYFESYTPTLMETENDTSNLNELFVQEKLDPRIESVLPILSKLHKKLDEMKEVVELDEWAKSLSEVEDETTKTLAEPADKMLDEAPGAETLAHNQSTEKSNLKAFDLAEDTGANEKYAEEIIDRIGYEGVLGNIDGNKIYRAVKEYQKMMDNPEDLDVDEVVEIIVDKLDIRHLSEDLGPEQKRVGQLGPTEKVKNNNIGKLVGASESAEHSTMNEDSVEARELELFATNDSDLYRQSYLPIVKNLERKFKKGIYDKELAKKLWVLHAARAAKKYGQEHGNDDGLKIFSTAVRREVAEKLRDDHFAEMEAGNFHDVPFSGSVPAKGTIVDKSGAKHSPMSRAKDLAQRGRDSVKEESITEMDNRTPQGDRREQRANSPEEIAKREKEFQDNLKKAGPEVRKKLGLPEPKDQGVAEGTKIVKELFEPQTDYYKLSNGEMVQVSYKPAANQEPLPGSLQISYVDPKVKPMGAASTAPKSWDQAPETIKQEISKWASSPEAKKQVDEAIEELNRILKLSGK